MSVELTSRIGEITKGATMRGRDLVTRTCMEVEAGAKRNLVENGSVVTGNLIGSIEADTDGFEGEVGTAVTYAPYVEFGTGERGAASEFPGKPDYLTYSEDWKGMSARPYLIPALESAREGFEMRAGGIYR
jgi:hypothetical protein